MPFLELRRQSGDATGVSRSFRICTDEIQSSVGTDREPARARARSTAEISMLLDTLTLNRVSATPARTSAVTNPGMCLAPRRSTAPGIDPFHGGVPFGTIRQVPQAKPTLARARCPSNRTRARPSTDRAGGCRECSATELIARIVLASAARQSGRRRSRNGALGRKRESFEEGSHSTEDCPHGNVSGGYSSCTCNQRVSFQVGRCDRIDLELFLHAAAFFRSTANAARSRLRAPS